MKLTKTLIKKIIKEEIQNFMTEEVAEQPRGSYSKMTDEELLSIMKNPSHFKNYYSAWNVLKKRPGYEGEFKDLIDQGKIPSIKK